ncbi:MAG: acyl-CoA dehydrogenase [Sneathiella sp.]|uniref:acyl-CoA dehydrogenase family protein n=1 Tax=Sneathiella sp. TaxID=1964365 RepID=UPI000C41F51A|nr:acyl-CoA dehydrogenase family protein [Sneathiella sp.]MAL78466.1 acyl-CoA dehydrogenase [Sneathiella sp.]
MDLADRAEHKAFRAEVREFIAAHRHLAPEETADSYRLLPRPYSEKVRKWQSLLVDKGYASRTVPKSYGGFGAEPDILKTKIITDEFFRAGLPPALYNQGVSMLVPTLLEHGSEEQKKKWIEPTIRAEVFWCQGYSEPGAGSDLASLQTRAHEDGDDFVINGSKIWTSSAHIADMIFCLVRTETKAGKYDGISYLIFSMDTPGIEVRPLQTMTGHPSFNEVFFTDVRVPKSQVVGGRGKGWKIANSTLAHERGMLANTNHAAGRLQKITGMLKSETLNGRPLFENAVMMDRFIRLQARVQALRLHEMRLVTEAATGKPRNIADMVCKLLGCELNHQIDAFAIDILGEIGVLYDGVPSVHHDSIWQQFFMYDLGLIIGGGTAQIQKNIIAERGLDMPREPKSAKG